MFCKKCGNEMSGNVKFCQNCGAPVSSNSGGANVTNNTNMRNPVSTTKPAHSSNATKKSKNSKNGTVIVLAVTLIILIIVFVLAVVAIKSGMLSDFVGKGTVEQESESERDDESSESTFNENRNEEQDENNDVVQESTEAVDESTAENSGNEDRFSKVESQNEEVAVEDGSVETAEPEDFDYILFDSDSRYVNENELLGFTKGMCRLARNEIYARYGRKFKDEELQNYFLSRSWYVPTIEPDDFKESMLNDYEIKNLEVISKYENEKAASDPEPVSSYKEAYKNVLENYVLQEDCENSRFCIGYVDGDDIPELFIVDGDYHAAAVKMYTYYNNQIVYLGAYGSYGASAYAPKKGYISDFNSGMGLGYEVYHLLKNGKVELKYHFSTEQVFENDELILLYYIDEKEVSKAEYDAEYAKAKDVIDSVDTDILYSDYTNTFEITEANISRYIMK